MANKSLVVPIPLNNDGMTGSANLATVSPNEALDAKNLTYFFGTQRKEGGTTKYNAAALDGGARIVGGHDWWPTPGIQRMVVLTSTGKLFKDSGGGTFATTLATGLNMSGVVIPVFVECGKESVGNNRLLATFTGTNPVQILSADGAVTTNLSSPPSDWSGTTQPPTGCVSQGRLWGFLGHLGYYSNQNAHQNFTSSVNDTSGTVPIFSGEGEYIIASCAFKGLIIVWKYPAGLYWLDVTSPIPFDWVPHRLSANIGIDSPAAFAVTDNDVAFTWQGNPYLISAVSEFGNIKNADLGVPHQLRPWLNTNLNLLRANRIQAVYSPDRREFHWAVAGAGATKNSLRAVLDFNRGDTARFRYSDLVTCESLWMRKDTALIPRVMAGDDVGFVRTLDVDARSIDGTTGYTSRIQTPHDDFSRMANAYLGTWGIAVHRKNGQWLEIVMEPTGNWNVAADIFWDGNYRQTVNYNMGGNSAALDAFILDTDVLGGANVANKKHRIVGSGRRFSVAFYNSGAGQDFSLAHAYLGVTMGTDRPGSTA